MQINFIAQPQEQLGVLLESALSGPSAPIRVIIVSAFASFQTVLRLKARLHALHAAAATIRIVVGVDLGGTSKEVLQELASWPVEVFVFKNKKSRVTFHPKLYIIESAATAEVFLGSNNLTDGGLYGNYEGAVRVTYSLPDDNDGFVKAKSQLSKFIEPGAPAGRQLDDGYLAQLLARRDIPSEAEAKKRRKAALGIALPGEVGPDIFGYEDTKGPPKLPVEVQRVVRAAIAHQMDEESKAKARAKRVWNAAVKEAKKDAVAKGTEPVLPEPPPEKDVRSFTPLAQISPSAFYLELVTTGNRAGNIPGEQRIPLVALNAAQEFFGWPDKYVESVNPRKGPLAPGKRRVQIERKPNWRVRSATDPAKDVIAGVRMYYLTANSDYRFHSGNLAKWANAGDIVKITRSDNPDYEYECVLAVAGTPEYEEWKVLCIPGSKHSPRVFGFS